MGKDFVKEVSERYIELYEHVTGRKFDRADDSNLVARIVTNVLDCLNAICK